MTMITNVRKSGLHSIAAIVSVTLAACSSSHQLPGVSVRPNDSGIEVRKIQSLEPGYLIGAGRTADGKLYPPDLPARVSVEIRRTQPLHNTEPRYFIPAAGQLQVASLEGLVSIPTNDGSILERWRTLLSSSLIQRSADLAELSEIPHMNAGRCFHGKLRKRVFPWGTAVLFLTSYVQGNTGGPVNNDMLVLVVQGLTNDQKYAVNGRFEIRHPELPDLDWEARFEGKRKNFSLDDESKEAEQWLDRQPDDSFQPSFGEYEKLLTALVIEGSTAEQVSENN